MSRNRERELREALFGEGRFAREWAPEPELLAELAPVLPAGSLARGLDVVATIGVLSPSLRGRLLAPLVTEALERGAEALDPDLIHSWRFQHLSAAVAKRLTLETGYEVPPAPPPPPIPAGVLTELAEGCDDDRCEETERFLDAASYFHDGPDLTELARRLSPAALKRLLQVIGAWRAHDRLRALALADVAPWVPEELEPELTRVARSLEEDWWRLRLLDLLGRGPSTQTHVAGDLESTSAIWLRELFGDLDAAVQERLIDDVMGGVMDLYGGSAAAAVTGPEEVEEAMDEGDEGGLGARPSRDRRLTTDQDPAEDEAEAPPAGRPPRHHHVNRGFCDVHAPHRPHPPHLPLEGGTSAYFWVEIAHRRLAGDAGGGGATIRADLLPEEARLTVAVFTFEGGITLTPGQDVGEIEVRRNGETRVVGRAAEPDFLEDASLLERRLFFPVALAAARDEARLRCNLYCAGVLVQSHLVTARLLTGETWSREDGVEGGGLTVEMADLLGDPDADHHPHGVNATVDYTLSHSLRPDALADLGEHGLSVLFNADGDGSHSFHFFSQGENEPFKASPQVSGADLTTLLATARSAMRRAAWGDAEPWQEGKPYRYEEGVDLETFTADLARLAKAGSRIYAALDDALAGGGSLPAAEANRRRKAFRRLTARSGLVQMASKDSATEVVPVALLHDHRVDTANLHSKDFDLCPDLAHALEHREPLEDTPCFRDTCPSRAEPGVVCASGFWGYRHRIGLPLSLPRDGDTVATAIRYGDAPRLTRATWHGQDFEHLKEHEDALSGLVPAWRWDEVVDRTSLEERLSASPHVLYFYCHGGLRDKAPYLKVGSEDDPLLIEGTTVEDLNTWRDLFWTDPRPLVFLNGCHTTALRPGDPHNLVTPFAHTVNAAGVIGTEITIFEALAARFAEAVLGHFFRGVALGEAVRRGRLALLAEHNPLGLVYVPFALASLTLRHQAA